ncbi:nuclear transport factor 2 family protein [Pedobacter sp. MC2016-15]|uniref:nuclear transport factor 2 family protein n=1 Tax=Pedobacter sp. MC2016-15 TaxID=2994473 RepID=UPI002246B9EA|nr:nuclear transport factor 2 family protein [Pedobacter sp. MC2016-15]MCX2480560.1 nuclear transport factor 2 family protein [Pedobacter sp. MC2016-15]
MNLPKVVTELVKAQNNYNAKAYADCFSETALVFDEGHHHSGNAEIQKWIEHSNQNYQSLMKPVSYKDGENESVLKAEVSGTFPGSPAILSFHFTYQDDLIQSLKITG